MQGWDLNEKNVYDYNIKIHFDSIVHRSLKASNIVVLLETRPTHIPGYTPCGVNSMHERMGIVERASQCTIFISLEH